MIGNHPQQSRTSSNGHGHDANSGTNTDDSSSDENLHNSPSKKRKRPTKISCELCKARKVKCDRAEPACGWCCRNNRVCIYNERKRPGLKASYGVDLEDKLNRLEASLSMLNQRLDEHIFDNSRCDNGLSTPLPANQRRELLSVHQAHEGYLQSPSPLQTPWPVVTSANPIRSFSHSESISLPPITAATDQNHVPQELPSISSVKYDDAELPPYDLVYVLVDMYFKHVNTWSPILDRKATFDVLFDNAAGPGEEEKVLLHAIVAVTMRFCNDERLTPALKRHYHSIARRKVQNFALETPTVVAMKALALITVDALGTNNGTQGWNLLALLSRNIVQLDLGVEKSVYLAPSNQGLVVEDISAFGLPRPDSWIDDEGRRRLFWLTYILDRYATIATNFDFILDEREISRSLPCRYDLFSKNQAVETRWIRNTGSADISMDSPENLGSFSYHCEVLRIMSQIHQFLRTPIDIDSASDVRKWRDTYRELDSKLNTWLSYLPGEYGKISQLCHSDPGSRVSNWIMIHAAFVTAVIRLHSVAAYPSKCSHIFQSSFNAAQRCLSAVDSLRAIAQDVIDTSMLDLLGPPFAFSLWTSSRLLLVHAATTGTPVDDKIWFLISTLDRMGQYWDVAHDWAAILTRLVQEGNQADENNRNNVVVSSGKTHTEMRRCAHDLGMLIHRPPRTVIDPPATRATSVNDLEYFNVFDWFNYPRLPTGNGISSSSSTHNNVRSHTPTHNNGNTPASSWNDTFSAPNPESDWLNFKQPYEFRPPYE